MSTRTLADFLGISLRPRVFVSYHHANDEWYYDQLSAVLHDQYETITDRSLDDEIESDDCDYTMRRIREEFITGTSCTLVLCGTHTANRKFVDWEIKATLDKEHGLIGIMLPSLGTAYRPWRLNDNILTNYAVMVDWSAVMINPQSVLYLVTEACLKPRLWINNSREMMSRNTQMPWCRCLGPHIAKALGYRRVQRYERIRRV